MRSGCPKFERVKIKHEMIKKGLKKNEPVENGGCFLSVSFVEGSS